MKLECYENVYHVKKLFKFENYDSDSDLSTLLNFYKLAASSFQQSSKFYRTFEKTFDEEFPVSLR